jgi:uncharacterized membrane protein
MGYLVGFILGAVIGVTLLTRLFIWLAGFWSKGYARVGWAYGMIAGFLALTLLWSDGPALIYLILIAGWLAFDLWRVQRDSQKAGDRRIPMTFD